MAAPIPWGGPLASLVLAACSHFTLAHRGVIDISDAGVGDGFTSKTMVEAISKTPWRHFLEGGTVLGRGAFGTATLHKLKEPCEGSVVVKKIIDTEDVATEPLQQEIATLTELRGHPNVVHLYDHFPKDPGQWFSPVPLQIMTEVAYGGELENAFFEQAGGFFGKNGRVFGLLSTKEKTKRREIKRKIVLMMARDVLAGLEFVHHVGYIHHDIKPANMWSADGDLSCVETLSCRYMIGDLGLASMPEKRYFKEGHWWHWSKDFSGTPAFMPPEMVVKRGVVFESDVYSVGVSLALIMAAPASIATMSHTEILVKAREKGYFPEDLVDLVNAMMHHDWKQRPNAGAAHERIKKIFGAYYPDAPVPTAPQEPLCVVACREAQKRNQSCDPRAMLPAV